MKFSDLRRSVYDMTDIQKRLLLSKILGLLDSKDELNTLDHGVKAEIISCFEQVKTGSI